MKVEHTESHIDREESVSTWWGMWAVLYLTGKISKWDNGQKTCQKWKNQKQKKRRYITKGKAQWGRQARHFARMIKETKNSRKIRDSFRAKL